MFYCPFPICAALCVTKSLEAFLADIFHTNVEFVTM